MNTLENKKQTTLTTLQEINIARLYVGLKPLDKMPIARPANSKARLLKAKQTKNNLKEI